MFVRFDILSNWHDIFNSYMLINQTIEMIRQILHSSRSIVVFCVILLMLAGGCKSKKKAMEARKAAEEKARIEQEAAGKRQQEAQQAEEERKRREAEERAKLEENARNRDPQLKLEQYFNAIAASASATSANNSITEALSLFTSDQVPVLIVIHESGGQKDYDRPTTIRQYLEYLKDQKKQPDKIGNLQFDSSGKITEVELVKQK